MTQPGRLRVSSRLGGCASSGTWRRCTVLLHAADALLITSDTEGMPGAAIEAMLTGIPVVATSVGALPEMGVTLADSTPQALASALETGRTIPVSRDQAKRFTWDEVAPQWVQLIERVTD